MAARWEPVAACCDRAAAAPKPAEVPKEKPPREKRKAIKNDPRVVSAARELRDRWLERVNADSSALLSEGKYDVSRAVSDQRAEPDVLPVAVVRRLSAAA